MKLRAQILNAAQQLVRQLLRARARFRKKRKLRSEFKRGLKMAVNRDPAEAHKTAIELNMMVARDAFYLQRAMVFYAGAEAVRQLIPTDPNPCAGATADERHAAKLILDDIDPDLESPDLFFALARRRCALLVAHHQPEILALARALEEKWVLPGKYVHKVFKTSLAKRSGKLMTF